MLTEPASKKIRLIGNEKKVVEDPLRILRAVRFSLNLNFKIEKNTKEIFYKHKNLIKNLTKTLVLKEKNKIDNKKNLDQNQLYKDFFIN